MLVYTEKAGKYYNIHMFNKDLSDMKEKGFRGNFYINLTNRCNCSCTFCLRNNKQMEEENTLWLKEEPSAEQIIEELEKYQIENTYEAVFCGFGEPTMALPALLAVASYIKGRCPSVKIRINTNGLANIEYGRDITPEFAGLVDTVSISLNASTAEKYLELTRNRFGLSSYEEMLKFARACEQHVPEVVMTVVDCIGEKEVAASQAVCDKWGLKLRVRPYEES